MSAYRSRRRFPRRVRRRASERQVRINQRARRFQVSGGRARLLRGDSLRSRHCSADAEAIGQLGNAAVGPVYLASNALAAG